jgi:hypothetical protein
MLDAERELWRAVLVQAYEDAEMTPIEDDTGAEPFECAKARRFLRADNSVEAENLGIVCEFADLPADRVYVWARRRYPIAA